MPTLWQITRPFTDLFLAKFGGIAMLNRLNNTPADIAVWERATSLRNGFNVTRNYYSPAVVSPGVSQGDPATYLNASKAWLVEDMNPVTPRTLPFFGRDVISRTDHAAVLEELYNLSTYCL